MVSEFDQTFQQKNNSYVVCTIPEEGKKGKIYIWNLTFFPKVSFAKFQIINAVNELIKYTFEKFTNITSGIKYSFHKIFFIYGSIKFSQFKNVSTIQPLV